MTDKSFEFETRRAMEMKVQEGEKFLIEYRPGFDIAHITLISREAGESMSLCFCKETFKALARAILEEFGA